MTKFFKSGFAAQIKFKLGGGIAASPPTSSVGYSVLDIGYSIFLNF